MGADRQLGGRRRGAADRGRGNRAGEGGEEVTLWRSCALAGAAAIAVSFVFGMIPGIEACGPGGPAGPIIAFELVTSPADVAALFPAPCADALAAAQRTGLWIDALLFIPLYSAFLALAALALRHDGGSPKLALACVALVLGAAVLDEIEGVQLFRILGGLPGEQSTIDLLMPAARGKFVLLGLALVGLGWLFWRRGGWARLAGAAVSLGGLLSILGLLGPDPAMLLGGSALGWLTLLAAAGVLSVRRAPA